MKAEGERCASFCRLTKHVIFVVVDVVGEVKTVFGYRLVMLYGQQQVQEKQKEGEGKTEEREGKGKEQRQH